MVNFIAPALGLLALAPLSLAAPRQAAPDVSNRDRDFSFGSWVEDIIANPDGDHLSPEEAVEAANKQGGSVEKRSLTQRDAPRCNVITPVANANDAATCIDQLAARGSDSCFVSYPEAVALCTTGDAQIVGVTNIPDGTSSSCNDVARAAGSIMDACWRADNTVEGSAFAWGNGDLAVHIAGPTI